VICPKCHEKVVVSFTGGGLISMTLEWYKRTKCLHCGYEGNDKKSGWIIP
jgi:predicted nucleic-acid-binding Zn-ribbon protein